VKEIAYMHDYILAYKKSDKWQRNLLPRTQENDKMYKGKDDDGREYRLSDYTCNKTSDERPNLYYSIKNPLTGKEVWPKKTRVWAYSKEVHEENVTKNLVHWSTKPGAVPNYKRYKDQLRGGDGVVPTTWWPHEFAGHTDAARKEVRAIFADHATMDFVTPKPSTLVERVLEMAVRNDPDSIILDSFAGSGTTLHAVARLNARDGGRRRCLLVEVEAYADTLTAERARRVLAGYGAVPGLGGQFAFGTLGAPLFDAATGLLDATAPAAALRQYVWWQETGTQLPPPAPAALPPDHPAYLGTTPDGARLYFDYHPAQPSTLDTAWLSHLRVRAPRYVVYADSCEVSEAQLVAWNVVYKKIPRDISRL
jgi:hypothetical protein